MKFAIAAFLCTLGLIHAYDFKDEAYNQFLVEQFSISHPRARRDTEKTCIDQESCCSDSAIQNYHDNDKGAREECSKELKFDRTSIRGPLTDEQKNTLRCIVECIGKKKGYISPDGSLIKEKLISEIKERLQTIPWLVPELDDMFNICVRDNKNTAKQEKQCNDIGMTVGHCVWKEIQLRCPENKQKDKGKCETLKEYLRQNKRFPPPPPVKC